MKTMLLIIGWAALGFGALTFVALQDEKAGAIHEIEALILVLVGVCGLGFGQVVATLEKRK